MEFLNSFFQNIKDKLTSPFFGTVTFVFIIHHWVFWYTLFNFDEDCGRNEKIAILSSIGKAEFGRWNIFWDVLSALIIMLIGYGIVMATRTLSLSVDFRFMPWITGKIISTKVVERELHEAIVEERDEYAEKYEEQRKNVRSLSKDYDLQTEQIQDKNKLLNANTAEISELSSQLTSMEKELSAETKKKTQLSSEIKDLKLKLQEISTALESEENKNRGCTENIENLLEVLIPSKSPNTLGYSEIPKTVLQKIDELKASGDWKKFLNYHQFEMRGGVVDENNIRRMQELGLSNRDSGERLSPLGRLLGYYIRYSQ